MVTWGLRGDGSPCVPAGLPDTWGTCWWWTTLRGRRWSWAARTRRTRWRTRCTCCASAPARSCKHVGYVIANNPEQSIYPLTKPKGERLNGMLGLSLNARTVTLSMLHMWRNENFYFLDLKRLEERLSLLVCVLDDLGGGALGQVLHEAALGHQPDRPRSVEQDGAHHQEDGHPLKVKFW